MTAVPVWHRKYGYNNMSNLDAKPPYNNLAVVRHKMSLPHEHTNTHAQTQNSHDHNAKDTPLEAFDEYIQNIVVDDLSVFTKVHGDERFVVSVFLVAARVHDASSVSAETDKDHVTGLTVLRQADKAVHDVVSSRHEMFSVVLEDEHFLFAEALGVDEVVFDILGVVVTGLELPLLSHVIDAHDHGATLAAVGWDNVHGPVHVDPATGAELWHLVIAQVFELLPHVFEAGNPGHGTPFVSSFVQDLQQ